MQRIKIHNFGPIRDAEIVFKPLVVLIGEQATGKLKDGTVNDAVQQMNSTIDQLITSKSIECAAIHGHIVTS